MSNMVDAMWSKVVAYAGGQLRVAVLAVFIRAAGAAAWARRLVSGRRASAGAVPPVGQQLLDAAVQLRGQPGEHVLEVGPGFVKPIL